MPLQTFGPDGRPVAGSGYWKDPNRTDIAAGSTGNIGLDMVNMSMPAGTGFGAQNLGGGYYGATGDAKGQGMIAMLMGAGGGAGGAPVVGASGARPGQSYGSNVRPATVPTMPKAKPAYGGNSALEGRRRAVSRRMKGVMGGPTQ